MGGSFVGKKHLSSPLIPFWDSVLIEKKMVHDMLRKKKVV